MWVYQSFDVEVQTEGSLEICDMYMFLRCLLRVIRLGEKINAKPMQLNWMVRSQGKFENLIFHEKQIWNIQSVLMSSATLWRSKVFYYKSPIYYSLNILISPESFWFCNYSINLWWIIDKRLIFYCHWMNHQQKIVWIMLTNPVRAHNFSRTLLHDHYSMKIYQTNHNSFMRVSSILHTRAKEANLLRKRRDSCWGRLDKSERPLRVMSKEASLPQGTWKRAESKA